MRVGTVVVEVRVGTVVVEVRVRDCSCRSEGEGM